MARAPEHKQDGKKQPGKERDKPAAKIGRPSSYTPELAQTICLLLAEGESLRSVCAREELPAKATVLRWIAQNESFRDQYARAKAEGAEAIAEEMFDIADDGSNDWMEKLDKEGNAVGYQLNGEHVQRSRLRIETRKWYLSKIMPKKYGDKVDLNHGVQPDNPLAEVMKQIAGGTIKPVEDDQ